MRDSLRYASPLSVDDPAICSGPGLELRAKPFCNLVGLRVDPSSPGHGAAAAALGLDLDAAVTHATRRGGRTALRLGPDEWLIDADADGSATVLEALRAVLNAHHGAAVDLSDALTAFELRGAHATDVLRKGCGLDLHPGTFGSDRVARTSLAQAVIVLCRGTESQDWRLYVDRSFASYTWTWLRDAAREFLEAAS